MISTFFDVVAWILAFCYSLVPSYIFAVAGLTIVVMVVVTPLTLKSTRSMLQMQRLQPQLKAIQNRHRGDRQRMNEEMMEFYKENGINPLGGCLPLLVQLPIFLVLFRVVQGITRRVTGLGDQLGWSTGRFGGDGVLDLSSAATHKRPFDPENLPQDSDMYADLVGAGRAFADRPTKMVEVGIDLSRSMQNVLSDGLSLSILPYLVLILLVLVTSLYQQRQIRGRNKGAPINPQQEMIMKIIPYLLPVFSFTMPAALVIYFVVSNLYRIGQQGYITHSLYKGDDSLGAQAARSRQASPPSGEPVGGRTTPKKGGPTPKRSAASSASKARSSKSGRAGPKRPGRASNAKGSTSQRSSGRVTAPKDGSKGRSGGSKRVTGSGSVVSRPTGLGRTGNAPSRHHRQADGRGSAPDDVAPPKQQRKKR